MKYLIILLLLIPLVHAETTFFDNPDDSFVMGDIGEQEVGITDGNQVQLTSAGESARMLTTVIISIGAIVLIAVIISWISKRI